MGTSTCLYDAKHLDESEKKIQSAVWVLFSMKPNDPIKGLAGP